MPVLFERFVVKVEPGPDGVLRPCPGATPRWEPAVREGTVHRQLSALVDATPAQIAAFASSHGLLRRGAPWLAAAASPDAQVPMAAMGQRGLNDFAPVRAWLERGAAGPPPPDMLILLAFAAVMTEQPDAVLQGFALAVEGKPGALVAKELGNALPDPAAFMGSLGQRVAPYLSGSKPLPADRARLLQSLDALEWTARLIGGLDEEPAWVTQRGGARGALLSLFRNQPEAFLQPALLNERNAATVPLVEEMARETVEDWHAVAGEFVHQCAAVRLERRALSGALLTHQEKTRLADLYRTLARFDAPADLTSGELAEHVLPLLRAELEAALVRDGVWPIRRGSVTGLYSRALVALWSELTDERPLVACATPGCPGGFLLVHGRLYCDACQAQRRQEDVRSSRAKAAGRADAG